MENLNLIELTPTESNNINGGTNWPPLGPIKPDTIKDIIDSIRDTLGR